MFIFRIRKNMAKFTESMVKYVEFQNQETYMVTLTESMVKEKGKKIPCGKFICHSEIICQEGTIV